MIYKKEKIPETFIAYTLMLIERGKIALQIGQNSIDRHNIQESENILPKDPHEQYKHQNKRYLFDEEYSCVLQIWWYYTLFEYKLNDDWRR